MSSTTLKDQILDVIKFGGGTTFVELERLPGFEGDYEMFFNPNLILWDGVSQEAAVAITELVAEKKIHFHPTSILVYVFDGGGLQLPLATKPKAYKKPHWVPVVMNMGARK